LCIITHINLTKTTASDKKSSKSIKGFQFSSPNEVLSDSRYLSYQYFGKLQDSIGGLCDFDFGICYLYYIDAAQKQIHFQINHVNEVFLR
jgi:hypothetical protein